MAKKKILNPQQEFEMMKMVLDKLLWIGVIVIVYGAYLMAIKADVIDSLLMIAVGIVLFIIFIGLLVRNYEWVKKAQK